MKARIFCKTGEFGGKDMEFSGELTIGSGQENQLQLVAKEIRLQHARILFDAGHSSYLLEVERGSTTLLDGVEVTDRVRLDRLHVITLGGRHDLIFQERSEAETPLAAPNGFDLGSGTIATSGRLATPVFEEGSRGGVAGTFLAKLKKIALPRFDPSKKGPEPRVPSSVPSETIMSQTQKLAAPDFQAPARKKEGEARRSGQAQTESRLAETGQRFLIATIGDRQLEFPLTRGRYTIGRSGSCDFQINHRSLSREHARIDVQNDKITLIDLESANKTFLEDQEVLAETVISSGQRIRFGIVEAGVKERPIAPPPEDSE